MEAGELRVYSISFVACPMCGAVILGDGGPGEPVWQMVHQQWHEEHGGWKPYTPPADPQDGTGG